MYFARSPEPDFHPEFGLMCPSSGFRRVARVAIVSIAIGATAGAIAVFSLAPRSDLAREKAFNIIFADEAAAANGAPATTGKVSSSSAVAVSPGQVVAHKPVRMSPAPDAESAASEASEERAAPEGRKASTKKKEKKAAQHRPRGRDRDVADVRDSGAYATPYGSRSELPRRDDVRSW